MDSEAAAQRSHSDEDNHTYTPWVIVAEDDDDMRELLFYTLKQRGFAVTTARDGEEMLAHISNAAGTVNSHLPDLIISDVKMPHYSGLIIMENIRKTSTWHIPVIFISAFADEKTRRRAKELNCTLLSKPFDVNDLVREIANLGLFGT